MKERPTRKPNRLVGFDYASAGCYFITFCTSERSCILGRVERPNPMEQAYVRLSDSGTATQRAILDVPRVYPGVALEHYSVMPNHVHLLITISGDKGFPSVSTIVQQTKRRVSKELGKSIWQSHFHDHIVRDEQDFQKIWQYIDNNPTRWSIDQYYAEE